MTALLPRLTGAAALPKQTRPARVCFVIDNLSRAGTESQLLALLRTVDRAAVSPTLVLLNGEHAESQRLEPRDLPVLRLGVTRLFSRRAAAAAWRLRRFWREHPPDIVQAYFLDSAYFALPIAAACGIRHRLRVRNNLGYWLTRRHRVMQRCLRPFVTRTLTNCASARAVLVERERLPAENISVLENGVDLARFKPPTDNSQTTATLAIGCVANLRPVKNIDGFMRAARIVLDQMPAASFHVAGEGPERPRLELLHAALQFGDSFVLHGAVQDVPGFLDSLAIAVLPSHSEGMSNALLEAMAAGRAVIATDVGENRAVLEGTGVLVPPGNDAALAHAILELLQSPARVAELGRAARRRVETHYSREAMQRRFEAFYLGLMDSRGS